MKRKTTASGETPPAKPSPNEALSDVEKTPLEVLAADQGIRAYRNLRCRVCGCTHFQPCEPPCAWVKNQDLCTGCRDAAAAVSEWYESAHHPNKAALWREVEKAREESDAR